MTVDELFAAIRRQGFGGHPIRFVDENGNDLRFRWWTGSHVEGTPGVAIHLITPASENWTGFVPDRTLIWRKGVQEPLTRAEADLRNAVDNYLAEMGRSGRDVTGMFDS